MRLLLEMARIIFIFGLIGSLGWIIIGNLYTVNETTNNYSWLGALAILILLFVLYRNKLQFSGWYRGKGLKKLPKAISVILIFVSIILIMSPLLIGILF